jgi:hypothetical protein
MSPLLVPLLFALPQAAPEPRVTHAQQTTRTLGTSLVSEFRVLAQAVGQPAWIAYVVPRTPRKGDSCLGNLAPEGQPVMLEGARHSVILFRVERRMVTRIHAYAIDCEIDAGDLPITWLSGVKPDESIRLLDSFTAVPDPSLPRADLRDAERLANSAVYAMGAHSEPLAVDVLIQKARNDKRPSLRRAAFQAIGRLRDPRAFAFLEEILRR